MRIPWKTANETMKKLFFLLVFCAYGAIGVMAQQADDILGVWFTEDKKSKVEVIKKKDGKYYGKIAWLMNPYEEDGKTPKVDDENPNKELRERPIIGLEFLEGMKWTGDEWYGGDIYDPQSGNSYSAMAAMPDKNTVKLRGYIGFSLLGRTTTWTRAK